MISRNLILYIWLLFGLFICIIANPSNTNTTSIEGNLDIIELTEKTFDKLSDSNDLIVIYEGNKCKPCKEYRELFLGLAQYAREKHNYTIAKLDLDLYINLYKRLEVRNKGIFRIIRKGMSPGYSFFGEPTKDNLIKWFDKFSQPSLITTLNSVKEVDEFTKDTDTIIYLGNTNLKSYFIFDDLAATSYNLRFGNCPTIECVENYKGDDATLLYFRGGTYSSLHSGYDLSGAIRFTASSSLDLINDGSDNSINKIARAQVSTIVIYGDSGENLENYRSLLRNVLEKRIKEGKTPKFVGLVTSLQEEGDKLKQTFKIKSDMTPTAFILNFENQPKKFKLEDNTYISEESISDFIDKFSENNLKQYYFSESIPNPEDEYEEGILKVVSDNFYKKVIDNKYDVMLFVHVPWCGYCQQFKNIYESLRRKLSYSNKLVLAKINAFENELDPKYFPKINGYPVILFWKATNKKDVIEYNDERQIYLLQKFINKHGTYVAHMEDEL